jgi:hypothetical protein
MIEYHDIAIVATAIPGKPLGRRIWLDGSELRGITNVTFETDVDNMTKVTLTMYANLVPAFEMVNTDDSR